MRKAALITGAGRGIGAATAREMSRRGHFVFLLGRNEKNLRETGASLGDHEVLLCDLDRKEQVENAVQHIAGRRDLRLEVLINNAATFKVHSFLDGNDDLWTANFQTNLLAPVRLTRALWPLFTSQKKGSIVNVSSTLGEKPTATTGAYSAMKAALINWTLSLAQEGGPHGVRVNAVAPGLVDTPIHSFHFLPEAEKTAALAKMAGLQPLGRIGTPDEVARSIAFLADEDSNWTTGAVLRVDGGIHLS